MYTLLQVFLCYKDTTKLKKTLNTQLKTPQAKNDLFQNQYDFQ